VVFKFEKLDVWQRALDYIDLVYGIAEKLPKSEEYNIKTQHKDTACEGCNFGSPQHRRRLYRSD
jgi:hypothetical protein